MSLPPTPPPNEPPSRPTPPPDSAARRRRARRQIVPLNAEGRARMVAALARRAYPTYEFFIFAVLCGAVIGLGFLLDSPPVLLFGILLAPLMTPWVGMLLALITGSLRFFLETLVATLITAVLVFLCGLLAGFATRAFPPMTFNNAFFHSQLWPAWLAVLAVSAILLVVSFVRSEEKPFLPSVMLAYSLFMPAGATGFGLGSGVEGQWLNGLLVFAVHLGLATLVGLVTLLALRFRPTPVGLALSGVAVLAILGVVGYLFLAPMLGGRPQVADVLPTQTLEPSPETVAAVSTATPTKRATLTPRVQTATPGGEGSLTPVPLTLEVTLPPSETPTVTLTIEPTPVLARIASDNGGGVNLRRTPGSGGTYMATLDNGSTVEVLPEVEDLSGVIWAHVIATRNGQRLEGWILQSVLVMATPVADWQPTATGTLTGTAEVP